MTATTASRQNVGLPIIRLTLREVISRKFVVWGLGLSVLFLILFSVGMWFLVRESGDPLADAAASAVGSTILTVMALYMVSFLAAFLALLVSVSSVSGEIDSGTIQAVLARPLRRSAWLVQRWAGLTLVMGTYVAGMTAAILLLAAVLAGHRPTSVVWTIVLMVAQATAVLTLGLFASARLSTLAAGVIGFVLFGMAWLAGIIEIVGEILSNEAMINIGVAVSLLMPSDVLWRGASFFAQAPSVLSQGIFSTGDGPPFASGTPPTAASMWWAAGWVALLLLLTVRKFSRRDL